MPLVLQTNTNPGAATWEELGALSGGTTTISRRFTLADLPAGETSVDLPFIEEVPALAIVHGVTFYLTTPPTGTGLSTFGLIIGRFDVSVSFTPFSIVTPNLFGAAVGFPDPALVQVEDAPNFLSWPLAASDAAWAPNVRLAGDISFTDMTALDVTAYVFYSLPSGFAVPA